MTKHRKAKAGDPATWDGREWTVHKVDGDALTLVSEDRTEYVGVHRRDRRLRVAVEG